MIRYLEYGYAAGFYLSQSCQEDAVQQLKNLQRRAYEYLHRERADWGSVLFCGTERKTGQ